MNKEKFDYSGVEESDRLMAEKWYMATKPSAGPAYHQWRVWNVAKTSEGKDLKGYKGNLIIEKASGMSVSPPPCDSDESEDDEDDDEEEVTAATVAMAAMRVE